MGQIASFLPQRTFAGCVEVIWSVVVGYGLALVPTNSCCDIKIT